MYDDVGPVSVVWAISFRAITGIIATLTRCNGVNPILLQKANDLTNALIK